MIEVWVLEGYNLWLDLEDSIHQIQQSKTLLLILLSDKLFQESIQRQSQGENSNNKYYHKNVLELKQSKKEKKGKRKVKHKTKLSCLVFILLTEFVSISFYFSFLRPFFVHFFIVFLPVETTFPVFTSIVDICDAVKVKIYLSLIIIPLYVFKEAAFGILNKGEGGYENIS